MLPKIPDRQKIIVPITASWLKPDASPASITFNLMVSVDLEPTSGFTCISDQRIGQEGTWKLKESTVAAT